MGQNPKCRFPELDWLRFLAAAGVMFFHYTIHTYTPGPWGAVSYPLLVPVCKYGYLGVPVFFIISGFVILLTSSGRDALSFVVSRMVRLYPAYWVCVTLSALGLLLAGLLAGRVSFGQYLANLTMIHWLFNLPSVDNVYWTLGVEMKFYLLVFLLLAVRQLRHLPWLLGAWLCASMLLSCGQGGAARFFLFPEFSSCFIAGAMFYLLYRDGLSFYKLFVIAVCCGVSVANALLELPAMQAEYHTHFSPLVVGLVLIAAHLGFLWVALRPRPAQAPALFQALGLMTYPLYLIHQMVGLALLRSLRPWVNPQLLLAAVVALMLALAYAIHLGPERWLARPFKAALLCLQHALTKFLCNLSHSISQALASRKSRKWPTASGPVG